MEVLFSQGNEKSEQPRRSQVGSHIILAEKKGCQLLPRPLYTVGDGGVSTAIASLLHPLTNSTYSGTLGFCASCAAEADWLKPALPKGKSRMSHFENTK